MHNFSFYSNTVKKSEKYNVKKLLVLKQLFSCWKPIKKRIKRKPIRQNIQSQMYLVNYNSFTPKTLWEKYCKLGVIISMDFHKQKNYNYF